MNPPSLRRPFIAAAIVSLLVLSLLSPVPAAAQTSEIDAAKQRAQAATQALSDAETRLGELDGEIAVLERRTAAAEDELDTLSESVKEVAIAHYTSGGDMPVLSEANINDGVKADAYSRYVGNSRLDTIDAFTKAKQELDASSADLAAKRAEQETSIADLEQAAADIQTELKRLEELEKQRQEEEARRAAAEKAAAERAARERAERERAAAAAARSAPAPAGQASEPADAAEETTTTTETAAAPATTSGGGMVCPVAGPHSFIDSWGFARSGGRRHQGVDMMANHGVPAVAPVSGVVTHRGNSLGGMSYHLVGDDGNFYYGTHLQSYGQAGRVSAGTVIGYVGSSGNASASAPHLHFEIHPNATGYSTPVNPYPATRQACG